jgi:hypothetical protein
MKRRALIRAVIARFEIGENYCGTGFIREGVGAGILEFLCLHWPIRE